MNLDHHNWAVVGYPCNQLPGDPEAILQHTHLFRATVGHLDQASSTLKHLDAGVMQGKFVPELLEKAGTLARDLDLVRHRYDAARAALKDYAPVLAHSQQEADSAIRAAETAKAEERRDLRRAREMWQHANISQDPVERQEYLDVSRQLEGRAQSSSSSHHAARRRVEAAMRTYDAAARRAAGVINQSIEGSQLNDSLYDKLVVVVGRVAQFGKELYESFPALRAIVDAAAATAKWIWDNIDAILLVLTVISLAIAWIPGVGALGLAIVAVLRVLIIAARILSKIKFATRVVSALGRAGRGDLKGLGGVAAEVALGKAGSRLYKGFAEKVSGRTWLTLRNASVAKTGKLDAVHRAYVTDLPPSPTRAVKRYFTEVSDHVGSPVTALGHSNNNLVNSGLGPLTRAQQDAVDVGRMIDNASVKSLVEDAVRTSTEGAFSIARQLDGAGAR